MITCNLFFVSEIKKKEIQIPKREKPENISKSKLIIGTNPNKASIDIKKRRIIIDRDIFNAPEPVRKAVLLHELAHYFYYDEKKCDEFSASILRGLGYPKSIIAAAFNSVLYSKFRKHHITKKIEHL